MSGNGKQVPSPANQQPRFNPGQYTFMQQANISPGSEYHVTTPPGGGFVPTQAGPNQAVPPQTQQQQQQQQQGQQAHRGMVPNAPPTPPQQQQSQQQPQQQDLNKMQQQQPQMTIPNFVPNATSVRGTTPNAFPAFRPQGQPQQPQRLAHHRSYLPQHAAMYPQVPMMFSTQMMAQGQYPPRQATPTQYYSNLQNFPIINTQHQMPAYAFSQPSPSQPYYFSVPQMGIPPRPVQGTNVPTAVPVQQQQQMPMQGSVLTQHQHQTTQLNKAPKNQRRKHAIKIVNPDSGKDVLEEVLDEKSTDESEDSSERQTPQPVPNPEVAAEFAARVALMVEKDESNSRTHDEAHLIGVPSGGDTMDGSVQVCPPDMTMINQHNHSEPKIMSNAKVVSGDMQILTQGVGKLGFIEQGLIEDDYSNESKMILKDVKSEISVSDSKLQASTREFIPENQQAQRSIPVVIGNNTTPVVSAMSDGPSVEIVPKHSSKSMKNIVLSQGSDSKVQNRKQQNKSADQNQNAEIKTDTSKPPTGKENQPKSKRNSESEVKLRTETSVAKKENSNTKVVSDKPNGQDLPVANTEAISKSSRKENQPGKQQATSAINQQQNSNKDVPQAPRPLYQQKQQQSNAGAVLNANISVPMPQPPKPNNKTQRNKEINRKGAEKQANASDMDAFNSPATPPAVPATAPPSSMPPPQPQMQPTTNPAANIVPVSNNIESSEIPAKEDATLNCNTPPASEANKLVPDNKDNSFASMISNNMNKPAPLASKNVLPKTLEGTKKVDVTSIVKGSDVMPKFTKKESPKESLDLLNLTEEEKLVRAKNEENKAKMEESQSETIGDGKVTLKYIYQEDQWSPTNQTGKKVYGRDFLVALQSDPKSKVKPNLPDMDVVLKEGANRQLSRDPPRNFPSLNRQHDALFPGFAKSQSQRVGKSGGSKGGSVSSKPGIIHVSLSLRDEVKLHETENAWKPSHMKNVNVNDDSRQTEELYKKVRGVLNKLTPQKFETLVRQVRDLDINTTERLKGVMDLVFEKAVDEPSFSVAYAYMCKELALIQVPADQQNGQSSTVEYVNFRKLLLSRCQNEFEKNTVDETAREVKLKEIEACTDPEKKKELQFNLEEEERKIRVKSVGNVRFIGELFKQGMLTTKIMMQCLRMLLQSIEEESLECLCKLLTTIGRDLEINKNQDLKPTFLKMQEIVDRKHGKISSRVRFMLQDVIELRLNKWKPRHNDTNPKTMDQIQKEAENEQMQIQLMNSTPTPRKDNDRRGNMGSMGSNDGRKRSQMNEDGWSTAGGRGSRSGHSFPDMSKLRQSLMPAIHATEDISLGKPQYGNWGHGSNMKSTPSQINYYSALENVEDDRRGSRNKNDPGYHSKGPSMERYKKYDENRSSRSGSQHRSRDNSSSRSHAPLHTGSGRSQQLPGPMSNMPQMTRQGSMPPPVMTPAFNQPPPQSQTQPQVDSNIPKEDIPEKLLNKMKLRIVDIVEDYANSSFKIEAAGQEIQSLCTTNQLYGFLRELYMACLEKNQVLREKAAQIVVHMIKNKLLPIKSYLCGLEEVLEFADDLRVDIPKMWEYLADLIAPVLASECVNLKDIHKISHVLISQDLAGEFIAAIFKTISKEKGPGRVKDIWAKSGLSWKSFMDEKKVDDFVKSKELDYVTGGAIHAINSSSHLSMKQIQERILKFMTENDSDANIEQWITMNVGDMSNTPAFARTLMTAVCEHSVTKHSKAWVLLENVFKKHYDLLTTYISNKPDCELQALYAIQCYMHKLEYPQGVLVQLFNMLWDSGIITGDSFLQWKNSTDPAEIEGKGVAEKCLVSFFTVLQEQDDESSTEE